jgi:hypothetical protein
MSDTFSYAVEYNIQGYFVVVWSVHHISICRWPMRCTIHINNFHSTVLSCSTYFERFTLSSSGAVLNLLVTDFFKC